jgi:hypothetical protein
MAKVWSGFLRALLLVVVTFISVGPVPSARAQITYPAPDEACYGCDINPNCIWTCPNGSHGSANVASELSCKKACKSFCGPMSNCWLI